MNKNEITKVARGEFAAMMPTASQRSLRVLRRPSSVDETDRLGRELVRRMMEAGVTEPR